MPAILSHESRRATQTPPGRSAHHHHSRRPGPGRFWPAVLAALALIIAAGAYALLTPVSTFANGSLSAQFTTHNFGAVKINGGLISKQFELSVSGGPVIIQNLGTT